MAHSVSLPTGKPAAQPDSKLGWNTRGTVSRALITSTVPRKERGQIHNIVLLERVNITFQQAVGTAQATRPESMGLNCSGALCQWAMHTAGTACSQHTVICIHDFNHSTAVPAWRQQRYRDKARACLQPVKSPQSSWASDMGWDVLLHIWFAGSWLPLHVGHVRDITWALCSLLGHFARDGEVCPSCLSGEWRYPKILYVSGSLNRKKKNNSPCISGVISPLSLPCIYLFLPQCTEAAMLQEPTELPSLPSTWAVHGHVQLCAAGHYR